MHFTKTPIPWYVFVGIIVLYGLILFYGSYSVDSNFFLKTVCSGDSTKKQVALSFDDGPADDYTPQVLEVLKDKNVPAAFFCIGWRVRKNQNIFREVYEAGHVIGNHSFIHTPSFDFFPADKMLNDLQSTDEAIQKVIGLRPGTFRPPYGVTTPAMKKAVARGGYTVIGWNIRSFDTISRDENRLFKKLMRLLKPGGVILLHDTQRITLSVLPRFIDAARNEGYEFVRLDKLLNVQWYA